MSDIAIREKQRSKPSARRTPTAGARAPGDRDAGRGRAVHVPRVCDRDHEQD